MSKVKINIELVGNEDDVLSFASLCAKIQMCGQLGCSRTIPVEVDGDGSARLRFDIKTPTKTGERDLMKDWDEACRDSFKRDLDNIPSHLPTHFIGE